MPYPIPPGTQFIDQQIVNFQNLPNKVSLSPENSVSILNETDTLNQTIYDTIKTQKTVRIYTWGRVTYHDVFGCRRWLNYCFITNDTPDQTDLCAQHNDPEGEPQACPK